MTYSFKKCSAAGLAIAFVGFVFSVRAFAAEPAASATTEVQGEEKFLDKYPHLKDNLYKEPDSGFQLGLSAGVLGLVGNNMYFSINFFQVHYITDYWDNELFSVAFGQTAASSAQTQSNRFVFRTVPKYRITNTVSLGGVLGYEYVSFPNVTSTIYKSGLTTQPEPFSSSGPIYGVAASENFKLDSGTQIKVTELLYQETYSVTNAGSGWSYLYASQALRSNTSTIQAGTVLSIEIGFFY